MFGPPGHLYVYFTYGMHHCCNVVVGAQGSPSAVLLRAGEVVDGVETARARRSGSSDRDLARGPARLCQALGIALEHNGTDLSGPPLELVAGEPPPDVQTGPRVGLRGRPTGPGGTGWRGSGASRRTDRRSPWRAARTPICERHRAAANVLRVARATPDRALGPSRSGDDVQHQERGAPELTRIRPTGKFL